jgi:hypothetical protein
VQHPGLGADGFHQSCSPWCDEACRDAVLWSGDTTCLNRIYTVLRIRVSWGNGIGKLPYAQTDPHLESSPRWHRDFEQHGHHPYRLHSARLCRSRWIPPTTVRVLSMPRPSDAERDHFMKNAVSTLTHAGILVAIPADASMHPSRTCFAAVDSVVGAAA